MNRKFFPIAGILLAAAMFGPASLNKPRAATPENSAIHAGSRAASLATEHSTDKKSGKDKSGNDKASEAIKLIPRSQLGPWVASCKFFRSVPQRSRGANIDLLKPSEGQISAIARSDFGTSEGTQPTPDENPWCIDKNASIQSVIVTVPDPVNGQLVLDFDRTIEAIQWAAQDYGYFDDQFWVPWDTAPLTSGSLDEKNNELMLRQIRETEPGLQIFRGGGGNPGELFVFLVAETPTLGINKAQLTAAIQYIQQIPGLAVKADELRILGPRYSGSVESFRKVLVSGATVPPFHVITPSATNKDALRQLRQIPHTKFEQLMHDDSEALERFLFYAEDSLHLDAKEIGIISESGTKYGSGTTVFDRTESPDDLHTFRFPREISVLRNAYPDEAGPSGLGTKLPAQVLALDLKQTQGKTDDVPPLSMGQLPMSQEAVLQEIVAQIRSDKLKLVGIKSTDTFDTLFLARFLKESCPDTRLFLFGSDLLLIRAAEDYPLEGTLTISDYPLFAGSHSWFRPKAEPSGTDDATPCNANLHFASAQAEATYNGLSALMKNQRCMRDYANYNNREPPLWLSILGRNGYWPVALLPSLPAKPEPKTLSEKPAATPEVPTYVESGATVALIYEAPTNGYLILCGLLIFVSTVHIYGFRKVRETKSPSSTNRVSMPTPFSWLLQYFNLGNSNQNRQKAFFFVSSSLILATIDYVIFLPLWVGFFRGSMGWSPPLWYLVICGITLGVTVWSIHHAFRLHLEAKPDFREPEERWVWFSWAVFLAFYITWSRFVFPGAEVSQFFVYRSFDLAGTTSPVLPFLFLLIALYLWCWTHIRRIYFWEARRAMIPAESLDRTYKSGFKDVLEEIDAASRKLNFHPGAAKLFFGTILVGFALLPYKYISGFEFFNLQHLRASLFDWLFICTLVLLYGFIFLALFRFVYFWSSLQAILRRLERQPLRHAFDRLPKKYYSWTPLWYSGAARRTFVVLARSLQCLQKLAANTPTELPNLSLHVSRLENALQKLFDAESKSNICLSTQASEVKENLIATSDYLLHEFLIPYWQGAGDSESKQEEIKKCITSDGSRDLYLRLGSKPPSPVDTDCNVQVAEEFVALRFIALIRYVGLQLRNLITFITVGFILSIISLRSYPFLAHRTIGWSLTLIFLAIGTVIVMVFSQMDKDAILSRITDTEPGKLDKQFYFRVISVGALPLLTVLASQFPAIGRFLFSWVQPAVEALH